MTATVTAILGMLLGGGLIGFIQFLISRSDNKKEFNKQILDKLDENQRQIKQCQEKTHQEINNIWQFIKEENARDKRTHILRFYEQLVQNRPHEKEYFDQIIDEIADYEKYCNDHPNFPNGRTVHAAQYIHKTYEKLLEKGKFIKNKK